MVCTADSLIYQTICKSTILSNALDVVDGCSEKVIKSASNYNVNICIQNKWSRKPAERSTHLINGDSSNEIQKLIIYSVLKSYLKSCF